MWPKDNPTSAIMDRNCCRSGIIGGHEGRKNTKKGKATYIAPLRPPTLAAFRPWGLASLLPVATSPKQTIIAITTSSRSSHIRLLQKHASAGQPTSSVLEATYMPLTQRLSSSVWRHSNGPSSGSTSGKAVSKYIPCTTLRLAYRRSSTLRKPGSMT